MRAENNNVQMNGKKRVLILAAAIIALASFGAGEDKPQAPAVTASKPFKLTGYTQVLSTTQSEGLDGLSIRRARFTLTGEIFKNVKIKTQIDVLKSPVLLDAQIDWTIDPAAALRVGQFKIPFSLESTTSSADLESINRTQIVNKLAPGWDIGSSGRDIGAVLTGRASIFEYAVGAFNGAGINKADTNDHKDFSGRLLVRPAANVCFGGAYYNGLYSAAAGAPRVIRDRANLEASWVTPEVSLKAEYIWAKDALITKDGWYVQAGYFFVPKTIQAILKFDAYDKNRALAGDRSDVYTAGLNWIFSERTKIQVNGELWRTEAGSTYNKTLLVQFQLAY